MDVQNASLNQSSVQDDSQISDFSKDQNEAFRRVSELQVKLWKYHTTTNEIYQMWFELFDMRSKICLWNSLDFPTTYFDKIAHEMNPNSIK